MSEQKQLGYKGMENIMEESKKMLEDYHKQPPQQMPTIKEFSKAKIKEGLTFLWQTFEKGKHRLSLEKQLLSAKAQQAILAKKIGQTVIQKVKDGDPIIIPDEMLVEAQSILAEKEVIEEMIEQSKKA